MKKLIPYLIIAILLVGFYYYRYKRAPDLTIEAISVVDSSGASHSLTDVSKSASVIHFYASWCGPCMREMRILEKEYSNLLSKGIRIICVTDDSWEKIETLRSQMPTELEFYQITSLKDINVYTIPATFFINSNGQIVKKQLDVCAWEDPIYVEEIIKITQ